MARSHRKQREWKLLSIIMTRAERSIDNQQQQSGYRSDMGYRDLTPYNAIERLPRKQNIII